MCKCSAGAIPVVVMAVCRLCKVFGMEEAVVVRKLIFPDRVKYFKAHFLKDNYSLQNKRMHIPKWNEYCDLDSGAKKSFLDIGRI